MIWFGWVLWHIYPCRLFNTESFLYIYIKYIWFGLVGFYRISAFVGYLRPNPLCTYIGRLNGVVSLVIGFEELSYVTSPFWSRHRMNRKIHPLSRTGLVKSWRGSLLLRGEHMKPPSFIFPTGEEQMVFTFLLYGLFYLFLECLWLLYSLGRELSSLLILRTIKCHIILIDLNCFLLNILLCYSLCDNLMHFKKRGVIYESTSH